MTAASPGRPDHNDRRVAGQARITMTAASPGGPERNDAAYGSPRLRPPAVGKSDVEFTISTSMM
jgi:hypothetical protein